MIYKKDVLPEETKPQALHSQQKRTWDPVLCQKENKTQHQGVAKQYV